MSPASVAARQALHELTAALRDLHRALVEVARSEYEREWGPVADAGQLLQLLTKHPQFDWLHQLSEFMVDIDALLDEEIVSEADRRAVFAQAKSLISPTGSDTSEFSQRYVALLQNDPALVMAHANVRRILAST